MQNRPPRFQPRSPNPAQRLDGTPQERPTYPHVRPTTLQAGPSHSQPRSLNSTARPATKSPNPVNKNEIKVCGQAAALALAQKRQEDVVRVYVTERNIPVFSELLRWCAENKKAYHVVTEEDLTRVAETQHHEGVCILAKQKPPVTLQDLIAKSEKQEKMVVVLLDNVENPHNIGAIMRVCAHFGADSVLLSNTTHTTPALSPSVFRTAEGGLEALDVVFSGDPMRTIQLLRSQKFAIVATHCHQGPSLYEVTLPNRLVLVLGSEASGLHHDLIREATHTLRIPGSGRVDSLNVACAASTVLGEIWRQHNKI